MYSYLEVNSTINCGLSDVQGEGLLSLAGARPPVQVEYREYSRPLKRLLKQMGSGSLSAGKEACHVRLCGTPLASAKCVSSLQGPAGVDVHL